MFNPLAERISIKEIIAAQIEEAILNKKYPPGSKLPSENDLCKMFGVSRTSVREALQMLNVQGLVSIEKGRGIFVRSLSSESVTKSIIKFFEHRFEGDYYFDLIHARQIIEPGIAYLAALNRREEDLIKLEKDIIDITNNDGDHVKHGEYDMSFHMHLAYASRNNLIPLLLKPIHKLMPLVKSSIMANVKGAKEAAVIWHTKILNDVKNQDAEGAKNSMIEHLKIAEEHIELALAATAKKN